MKPDRLLQRIQQGHLHNVDFDDFRRLVELFGFRHDHTTGSHRHYVHPGCPEPLVITSRRGQAQPFQMRTFTRLLDEYALQPEAD